MKSWILLLVITALSLEVIYCRRHSNAFTIRAREFDESMRACHEVANTHFRAGDIEGGDFVTARCYDPSLLEAAKEKAWREEYRRRNTTSASQVPENLRITSKKSIVMTNGISGGRYSAWRLIAVGRDNFGHAEEVELTDSWNDNPKLGSRLYRCPELGTVVKALEDCSNRRAPSYQINSETELSR
jgi:hypothetical protein